MLLSHHSECVERGIKRAKSDGNWTGTDYKKYKGWGMHHEDYGKKDPSINPDGYETVPDFDCHRDCPIRMLDEQSGITKSGGSKNKLGGINNWLGRDTRLPNKIEPNSGGASRFFKILDDD